MIYSTSTGEMTLSEQQHRLLEFVKEKHGDQKRKYSFEPYWNHVFSVAQRVARYEPSGIEPALCHDLLEDTNCTQEELHNFLEEIHYSSEDAELICSVVQELTDEFTHENYPELNRAERNKLEAKRLGQASYLAQSIKYADIADNVSSVAEHDLKFAQTYVPEKLEVVNQMRNGHVHLLIECCAILKNAIDKLG